MSLFKFDWLNLTFYPSSFALYLRLHLVICLTWIFKGLALLAADKLVIYSHVSYAVQGLVIFVLFVLNRRVLHIIGQRFVIQIPGASQMFTFSSIKANKYLFSMIYSDGNSWLEKRLQWRRTRAVWIHSRRRNTKREQSEEVRNERYCLTRIFASQLQPELISGFLMRLQTWTSIRNTYLWKNLIVCKCKTTVVLIKLLVKYLL